MSTLCPAAALWVRLWVLVGFHSTEAPRLHTAGPTVRRVLTPNIVSNGTAVFWLQKRVGWQGTVADTNRCCTDYASPVNMQRRSLNIDKKFRGFDIFPALEIRWPSSASLVIQVRYPCLFYALQGELWAPKNIGLNSPKLPISIHFQFNITIRTFSFAHWIKTYRWIKYLHFSGV